MPLNIAAYSAERRSAAFAAFTACSTLRANRAVLATTTIKAIGQLTIAAAPSICAPAPR